MKIQSLQLSALTLVGSPTTSLRKQYLSALEPRNFFLSVVDIYRRISFVPTKVRSFLPLINRSAKLKTNELRTDSKPAANNIEVYEDVVRRNWAVTASDNAYIVSRSGFSWSGTLFLFIWHINSLAVTINSQEQV